MQLSNASKAVLSAAVTLTCGVAAIAAMCTGGLWAPKQDNTRAAVGTKRQGCPNDDSGLQLPAGFCATVFADGIGHARHMVVAPSGALYVNTWSGRYYGDDTP